ncbi:MAG: hypothetical protein EXS05_06235, partial [Planctomycetaceae bacterium]|nr:hypothetical protein [Planctomycetaceae bacterium]
MSEQRESIGEEVGAAGEAAPLHRQAQSSWRCRLGVVATVGTSIIVLASVAGLAGRLYWLFDISNHFRVQSILGVSVGAGLLVVAGRRRTALLAAGFVLLCGWSLLSLFVARPPVPTGAPGLRVMALNVWARNFEYQQVENLVRETSPDIVVLEEIDDRWEQSLSTLNTQWPYCQITLGGGHLGIALLSRRPLEDAGITFLKDGVAVVRGRVTVDKQPITIFGVHLARPTSSFGANRQTRQLAELVEMIRGTSGQKIVLGDFNSSPWSTAFTDFVSQAAMCDTRPEFGVQPSWPSFLPAPLRIPIDHCLVSEGLHPTRRKIGPNVGSDH